MKAVIRNILLALAVSLGVSACIEPPLHLPGDEVLVDMPMYLTDLQVVWDVDLDFESDWHYGWDETDVEHWGPIGYPYPSNYEVRRYYLGNQRKDSHDQVDGFTIFDTQFRRYYNFGYYDMLVWSNIDSEDGAQVLVVDEKNLDEVRATTTGTKGLVSLANLDTKAVAAIYNQPEIFYSSYIEDLFISRNFSDYDYYDEKEDVWVKKISTTLTPLVYIYLVQIIIYNNDGRIIDANGDCAVTGFASSTSVNTGHTGMSSGPVYFQSRMKKWLDIKGQKADVVGGKLTTFGLCDMEPWTVTKGPVYKGSRASLSNILYFDLTFVNGKVQTLSADVTEQCQRQAHGGIITIELDAQKIKVPGGEDDGSGSLFVPTVDDYEEVVWDFEI